MSDGWRLLLGALVIWAAHFLVVYAVGEFFGDGATERLAIVASTPVALAAVAWCVARGRRIAPDDGYDRWRRTTVIVGGLIAAIAILWQTLPAVLGSFER